MQVQPQQQQIQETTSQQQTVQQSTEQEIVQVCVFFYCSMQILCIVTAAIFCIYVSISRFRFRVSNKVKC